MRLLLILAIASFAMPVPAQSDAVDRAAAAGTPDLIALASGGVFRPDPDISNYICVWARYLLKQDRDSSPERLRSGLTRKLDEAVELLEPSGTPLSPEELFERCAPGVLIISRLTESNGWIYHASGFVIRGDGLALTNYHVVKPAAEADILVATTLLGRVVRVKEILATSKADDVALIQLDGDGFHALPIARSAAVGSDLVAITHPAGWGVNEFFTLSKGHLARHRTFFGRPRAMVTARYAIGSSGGPILDRFGAVACMVSRSRSFVGNRVPVFEKDGALKLGRGWSRGYHLAMEHQMTLGITVPCQSIRAFLTPATRGQSRSGETLWSGIGGLLSSVEGLVENSVPGVEPLLDDGVFREDGDISKYIGRWAKHLRKLGSDPGSEPLRSGLNRILDREVYLLEPSDTPMSAEELYDRCAPGVLIISSLAKADGSVRHSSGFVISADGLALTSRRAVASLADADVLVATTLSGRVVQVKEILATDEADDVALLQLDGDGLRALPIAKSAAVGADLVAIGHPAGSGGLMNEFFTQTTGHLARHSTVRGRSRHIVTAAFAKGSGGAPILDRFGSVVCLATRSRSFIANRVAVHGKGGALQLGEGPPGGYFLPMDHQMTLGVAVPFQSMRAFLELESLGPAQNVDAANYGLEWRLYEGAWSALPDFAALEPAVRGACESPAVDVQGERADDFALVFDGFVDLPSDGAWRFRLTSDDGSRLFVDEQLVVDNDGLHAAIERVGGRRLAAGLHAIRIEFFERDGEEELQLEFSGPGQPWTEIPAAAFRRR